MYSRINDPIAAIETLGNMIASSGMFGCNKIEQGQVLAMQCLSEGKPPLELAKTYHVIDGKLSMRSDAMLAKFQMAGGKVQWTQRDNKVVSATFTINGSSLPFTATLEDFVANGVAVGRDGKSLKDNWRKFTRQMLTARVISEAVRLLAPEIVFGVYTPEEIQDSSPAAATKPIQVEVVSSFDRIKELEKIMEGFDRIGELEKIMEGIEDKANAFLLKKGYIKEGQNFRDIDEELASRIIQTPKLFINQVNNE
jgi:hypothetical protein